MKVTIDLPEDIATALKGEWADIPQRSLEAIAVEAYRTGVLHESQVRRLLGFETRQQVHSLLKEHRVPLKYTQADLDADLAALGLLGPCDDCWKYVFEINAARSKLFDVCRDPNETVSLSEGPAERVNAYRDHVAQWSAAQKASVTTDSR